MRREKLSILLLTTSLNVMKKRNWTINSTLLRRLFPVQFEDSQIARDTAPFTSIVTSENYWTVT